ncbi:MAG: hypothetical protein WD801_15430 [Gemmatimonadaceae bacterium]
MMRRAVLLALLSVAPQLAPAQGRERCTITGGTTGPGGQTIVQLPSGQRNSFMGGGVLVRCPVSDLTLRADSLESYGDEGRIFLMGSVHYDEPRLSLNSRFLTYHQRDEHIVASGDVDARLPNGSSLRGPVAEYFRAIPVTRPVTRLFANGRPTISVVQRDSTGAPGEPLVVIANNVLMLGDSLVYAGGVVTATRPEIEARGDSMALDSQREVMVMMRDPVIEGRGERAFTLQGARIELTSVNRELRRVLSMGQGKAVSQDLTLTSDTIDLRVADDLLQRAIVWGPSRAHAVSPAQRITADSIDVSMPAQRLREMHAVRGAIAQGEPDSVRFRADTLDWMRGDTIVARFDTLVAGDTASGTRLRELVALGNARSYHHMAPSDTTMRRPAINYVRGREITVAMENQAVAKVTVIGQAAGMYLEPRAEVDRGVPRPRQ